VPYGAFPGLSANEIEDSELLWRHRPGYQADGPINSHGFRGAEFPLEKDPAVYRIVSLGESTSYGDGVEWQETYSFRLEEMLRARGYAVQVINAGVRAWTTYQSTRFLELEIANLKPDLVLFYHEVNDFLPTTFRGLKMHGAGMSDIELIELMSRRRWLWWTLRNSRLLSHLRLHYARSQASETLKAVGEKVDRDVLLIPMLPYSAIQDTEPGTDKPWLENENRLVRVPDHEREKSLRRLIELVRSHGVELILLHPTYPISRRHRDIQTRIAVEENIHLIDAEDSLYEYAIERPRSDAQEPGLNKLDYFIPNDAFHFNALGHTVIAEAIADYIEQEKLIPEDAAGR
jgi:lysophospholipase L1-like esterase